jgi:threonine-phosphate decarboxylase
MIGVPVHGGNRRAASRRTGIPEERLLDFSASVSPYGLPRSVEQVVRKHAGSISRYPDPYAELLSARIGRRFGINRGSVLCGNGSTDLIYLIARALKPDSVLIPAPTFSEYERACRISGARRVVHHALKAGKGFELSSRGFIAAMEDLRTGGGKGGPGKRSRGMAFRCNPNNPTGRILEKKAIREIAAAARDLECHLVVDEAFADFCPGHSVIREVRKNPSLIVLRSLTKFYGLAGLRAGFCVLPPAIIDRVRRHREPWAVNALAQQAGIAVLADEVYERNVREAVTREKAYLERHLGRAGIEFIPSQTNYYLLRLKNARAAAAGLERKGILVRDCSDFRGLDGSYVRIAVRSREENRILMKELADLCGDR